MSDVKIRIGKDNFQLLQTYLTSLLHIISEPYPCGAYTSVALILRGYPIHNIT